MPLANSGGQSFGPISLTDALTNSVNTVWAQVGEQVGRGTLVEYMDRFGFNEDPQLDYPDGQMIASGVRDGKGRLRGGDAGFDVGPRGHRPGRPRGRDPGERRSRWPRWPPRWPTAAC